MPQAQPNSGASQQANSAAPSGGAPQIVGSVFGENLTWDDFIAQFRKDFPQQFENTVAQVIGPSVADQLFGDSPKTSVTLTPDEVLQQLKQNPPASLYNAVNAILQLMMVEHEASVEGVTVTPAEVDQALDQQLKQLRTQGVIPANLTDDQFLAQRHISRDQLRVSERFRLLLEGLMKKNLEKKLGHPIGPGDFVDARHILIKHPIFSRTPQLPTKRPMPTRRRRQNRFARRFWRKRSVLRMLPKNIVTTPALKTEVAIWVSSCAGRW